jgi:hypothetical protein
LPGASQCVQFQASLETESKGKAELLRVKKKLEADINVRILTSVPIVLKLENVL